MKKIGMLVVAGILSFGFQTGVWAHCGMCGVGEAHAQKEGSDSENKGNMHEEKGNQAENKDVALKGFCPVCIFSGVLMKGTAEFSTEYEGKTYYFPGQEQLDMFNADPKKYLEGAEDKLIELKGNYDQSGDMDGSDMAEDQAHTHE